MPGPGMPGAVGLTLCRATVPRDPRGLMGQPGGDTEGAGRREREERAGRRRVGGPRAPSASRRCQPCERLWIIRSNYPPPFSKLSPGIE